MLTNLRMSELLEEEDLMEVSHGRPHSKRKLSAAINEEDVINRIKSLRICCSPGELRLKNDLKSIGEFEYSSVSTIKC